MSTEQESFMGLAAAYPRNRGEEIRLASLERRSFLGLLLGAGAAAVGAFLSVPLLRFALHPLLRAAAPLSWAEVGSVGEFASVASPVKKIITIEQRDGWRKTVSEKALYVFKDAKGGLCALSAVCPHLGCSVAWQADKGHFKCPCHNGEFAPDGKHLAGPPPRGMDMLECKVDAGILKVQYQSFRQAVPKKEVVG